MKASIIVLSPSGHTLRAAEHIRKLLEEHGDEVQLINVTKNEDYLNVERIKGTLQKELKEHDVLFIGGPIYAGHMERHILNIIEQLPAPDKRYTSLAVPFATYGGVHSSVALEEMGKLLREGKRKSLLGIKIAAEHTLTKTFGKFINEGLTTGDEGIIDEAVEKIIEIVNADAENIRDASNSFSYSSLKERILFKVFSQEAFHKKFKSVTIDKSKCIECKKCIEVCPVNMYSASSTGITMNPDNSRCILCAECYHNCPVDAIDFPYLTKARVRLKDGNANLEEPQSAIYK